jgi:hypothetical protein
MRPLPVPGVMNKTEARYAAHLEGLKQSGWIIDYSFESVKLRLAKKTFYAPDFFVVFHDHFEVHEVKGFWRDDARVKIKVAARLFPYWKFQAVQWKKKDWIFETIR